MKYAWMDSLLNLVSGLGTSDDKSNSLQYTFNELNESQLVYAYRGDWIARKIIDIPAEDATREWRVWQAEKDQITAIEKEEERLGLLQKTQEALINDRLLGGGALVIGLDDVDWSLPIDIRNVKQGDLKYVHAVDRTELTVSQLDQDVRSPFYGEPINYQVSSQMTGTVVIHPSRVVRFVSHRIPTKKLRPDGWGDPVIQSIDSAIKNAGLSQEGIATLINEASVNVISVPDFMDSVSTAEYRTLLIERFQLANTAKSMINALILDKEEEWEKLEPNFSGLADLIRLYLNVAAGAGDIPATRLLGQSPSGLNATGESDIRNYYDKVRASQKNHIGPALSRLDEVLIRSALGERPKEITYSWVPLWQPTENEKADVLLKRTQALGNIFNTGYVPDEAMALGAQNMLIEDNSFPGLEAAIDNANNEDGLDELDPNVQTQFGDAKPRTLYVSRKVLNGKDIVAWAQGQGISNIVDADKMHVTITFSRTPVNWLKMGNAWVGPDNDGTLKILGGPREMELYGRDGKDLVLSFASHELEWRHRRMRDEGASWDWGEYQPHITIAYDLGDLPDGLEPYQGDIVLGPEVFEEVNEDWKETL